MGPARRRPGTGRDDPRDRSPRGAGRDRHRIRAEQVVTVVDSVSRDAEGRVEFHYTLVEIAAEYVEGEAKAADDVAAVRWVGLEDVNHLVSWEETRRVIREAARQRRASRRERTRATAPG